jgi:hypothetical protein
MVERNGPNVGLRLAGLSRGMESVARNENSAESCRQLRGKIEMETYKLKWKSYREN